MSDTPSRVSPSATETPTLHENVFRCGGCGLTSSEPLTGHDCAASALGRDKPNEDESALLGALNVTSSYIESLPVAFAEGFQTILLSLAALREENASLRSPSSPVPSSETHISGICWLLIRDGCVLMERCPKKAEKLGVGEWFIPGGKIEGTETPFEALIREVDEEWPGVDVMASHPLPILQGSPIGVQLSGAFLMQPFVIQVRGEIPTTSADGVELKWTPIAEALASPVPQVRMMVAATIPLRPPSRGTEPEDFERMLNWFVEEINAHEVVVALCQYACFIAGAEWREITSSISGEGVVKHEAASRYGSPEDIRNKPTPSSPRLLEKCSAIRGYVSRLRHDGEICAKDHSDAWEEIRSLRSQLSRIQQTGLTAEEAQAIIDDASVGTDDPRYKDWCSAIVKLRSLAALRSLEGDRGK